MQHKSKSVLEFAFSVVIFISYIVHSLFTIAKLSTAVFKHKMLKQHQQENQEANNRSPQEGRTHSRPPRLTGPGLQTTIDSQNLTTDKTSCRTAKKSNHRCYFVRTSKAFQRTVID